MTDSTVEDDESSGWDVPLGKGDARTAIHARHGGSTARGISAPGKRSGRKNILLWWRPEHGSSYGYADGWTAAGDAFYFTGTGQYGDQVFESPLAENGRLRDHHVTQDRVRLLRYVGKNEVQYVGELELDPHRPWTWETGIDREGQTRRIIQFRLLPVGSVMRFQEDPVRLDPANEGQDTPLEQPTTEPSTDELEALRNPEFKVLLRAREIIARRRESELVHAFAAWAEGVHRLEGTGLKIPHAATSTILRADLFIPGNNLLVEAKSSANREAVRLAIGQLFDYARWLDPRPDLAILLPHEPPNDMLELLSSLGIGCIWRRHGGFDVTSPDLLERT